MRVNFILRRRNIVIRSVLMDQLIFCELFAWLLCVCNHAKCTIIYKVSRWYKISKGKKSNSHRHGYGFICDFILLLLRFFSFTAMIIINIQMNTEREKRKKNQSRLLRKSNRKTLFAVQNNVLTAVTSVPLVLSIFNIHSRKADFYTKR